MESESTEQGSVSNRGDQQIGRVAIFGLKTVPVSIAVHMAPVYGGLPAWWSRCDDPDNKQLRESQQREGTWTGVEW